MTHIDPKLIEAAMPYFEKRDLLARLLKKAGVKKHAREYVAEVLLDAGVIDLDELEVLANGESEAEPSSDALAREWLGKPAWWNAIEGEVVGVNSVDQLLIWRDTRNSRNAQTLPASWLTHESPEPDVNVK